MGAEVEGGHGAGGSVTASAHRGLGRLASWGVSGGARRQLTAAGLTDALEAAEEALSGV
jgi:hypothetical protein